MRWTLLGAGLVCVLVGALVFSRWAQQPPPLPGTPEALAPKAPPRPLAPRDLPPGAVAPRPAPAPASPAVAPAGPVAPGAAPPVAPSAPAIPKLTLPAPDSAAPNTAPRALPVSDGDPTAWADRSALPPWHPDAHRNPLPDAVGPQQQPEKRGVQEAMRAVDAQGRACFEAWRDRNPLAPSRVTLVVRIDQVPGQNDARIAELTIAERAEGHIAAQSCLLQALRQVSFVPPRVGTRHVTAPWGF